MRSALTFNEKLNFGISLFALLVSLSSGIHTFIRDRRSDAEQLVVSATRRTESYATQVFRAGPSVAQVSLDWTLLIANNGTIPLSVTGYDIWGEAQNRYTHTRMDLGLFRPDGTLVKLPMSIEPGHAEGLVVRTGHWLPHEVQQVATETLTGVSHLAFSELQKQFARRGFDIFGNRVAIKEWGNEYTITGPSSQSLKQPTFLLTIRTARGQTASSSLRFY